MSDHGLLPETLGVAGVVEQEDIDAAVGTVRALAGWHIWPLREDTITVDTSGDAVIFLPTKHLVSVESVVDRDGATIEGVSWSEDGMVLFNKAPKAGFRTLTLTIRHGYDVSEVGEIVQVCKQMAGRASRPQEGYTVGRISTSAPGGVTPQSTEWRIIDLFKLGPLP